MEQKKTTEEAPVSLQLAENVKKLFTFDVNGAGIQRLPCYELLRNLKAEGLIGEKDNSILNFPCDDGENGTLKTTYTPEIHTREFAQTRPQRGIRFCHLRDGMLFAQHCADRRIFENLPKESEILDCIFVFWGSKTPVKDASGFFKKNVLCVSFEETDERYLKKPMLYSLPLTELFDGEYAKKPKFTMIAEITYDAIRSKRSTGLLEFERKQ